MLRRSLGAMVSLCVLGVVPSACGSSSDSGLGGKGGSGGTSASGGAGGSGGADGSAASGGTGAGGTGATGGTGAAGGTGATGGAAGAGATGGAAGGGATGGAAGSDGGSCPDADADGQTTCAGDCNDADPTIFTGNKEICGDAKDNNCNNQTDEGCNGIGTYVSANVGLDTNPGTQAQPVKTIAKGMTNAQTIGGGVDVYVAEGHYTEKVTMVEGMDLLGGYQCSTTSCTWARDFTTYDTAIFDTDAEGVKADSTITRATKIEGFRIMGQSGSGAGYGRAAMSIAGGSPTVANDKLVGPDVVGGNFASGRSIGLAVLEPTADPKGALVDSNTITSGASGNASIGILFDTAVGPATGKSIAEVRKNKITSGNGVSSSGIAGWTSGAATLLENNDINAGNSTATGSSFGISVGGAMTINANRVNVGGTGVSQNAGNWSGGIASLSSTTIITNNVVTGLSAPHSVGVLLAEAEVPAGLVILNGNTISAGGLAGTTTRSAAFVSRIGTCGTCGFAGVNGHVRNNILIGGVGTGRFIVFEDAPSGKTTHPQIFENNLLFFPTPSASSDVLYGQWNGSATVNITTIAAVNALTLSGVTVGANITGDPLLDSTFHLGSGSPAVDKGTATEAPAKDMDGDTRPKGAAVDIGADEGA